MMMFNRFAGLDRAPHCRHAGDCFITFDDGLHPRRRGLYVLAVYVVMWFTPKIANRIDVLARRACAARFRGDAAVPR